LVEPEKCYGLFVSETKLLENRICRDGHSISKNHDPATIFAYTLLIYCILASRCEVFFQYPGRNKKFGNGTCFWFRQGGSLGLAGSNSVCFSAFSLWMKFGFSVRLFNPVFGQDFVYVVLLCLA
jgi:hypothetical protein